MAGGIAGAPNTPRMRGALLPQELIADTDKVQTLNEDGQSTETALRFSGPTSEPHVTFQLYDVASGTGLIE